MSLIRTKDKIPEVYTNTSRDFQLITRLYDIVINGVKFDTDSIKRIINTNNCDSKLLQLLQTKLGFFSKEHITDEDLRKVLKAFPTIVKNKGSIVGIEQAVRVFLSLHGIKSEVKIDVVNKSDLTPYTIFIYIDSHIKNTTILDEIFKYILPTGYNVRYVYYGNEIGNINDLDVTASANLIIIKDSVNSLIRGNYISYRNDSEDRLIGSIGEVQVSTPYDLEYRGIINSQVELPNVADLSDNLRGIMYIEKTEIDDNYIFTPWVFDYDSYDNLNWINIGGNRANDISDSSYNIYSKSVYGYYDSSEYKFYLTKENKRFDNVEYTEGRRSLEIYGTPDNALIPATSVNGINEKSHIVDVDNGIFYRIVDGEWIEEYNSKCIEILRIPTTSTENGCMGLSPSKDVVAFNGKIENGKVLPISNNTSPLMWKSVPCENDYKWGDVIYDESEILDIYNNNSFRVVQIQNTPENAFVVPNRETILYNKYLNKYWVAVPISDIIYEWVEDGEFMPIYIKGTPSNAMILPYNNMYTDSGDIVDLVVSDGLGNMWEIFGGDFSDEIEMEQDTLYIDRETSCAYNHRHQKVVDFVKAENIYEISYNDLLYMLENKVIKPVFKNNKVIFTDSYDNILLL